MVRRAQKVVAAMVVRTWRAFRAARFLDDGVLAFVAGGTMVARFAPRRPTGSAC
jgi:hypothetical protein